MVEKQVVKNWYDFFYLLMNYMNFMKVGQQSIVSGEIDDDESFHADKICLLIKRKMKKAAFPGLWNEDDDQAQIDSSIMEEGRSIDKNWTAVGQSY